MKTSILVATIVASFLSASIVSAKEETAPAVQGMGMDKQMSQMQGDMKKMQQQMEKVRATNDPKERQKLMQEHMQAMQENMKSMRSMGGPMMLDSSQSGGMAMDGNKNMTGGDMAQRQEMMTNRMDMMQMMMEQMMQHDQMTETMPAK
jgi:biotin-(acetyl-CoA carboxylase) ligase